MKKVLGLVGLVVTASLLCSTTWAAGSLKISGSTTVLPISQLWAEGFMAKHSEDSVSVSGGGTGTGISQLLNGTSNIANASREVTQKEIDTARSRNKKIVGTKIAKDGLSIIVNPANNVSNLTMAQLRDIYSGKITNWKQVGGKSGNSIVVVGRDTSSGTYGFFQEAVLDSGPYVKGMLSQPSNAAVAQAVSQSRDAIGYVGMAYADEYAAKGRLKILAISTKSGVSGKVPTAATVQDGSYPLWRYLYCYTIGKPSGLAAEFLKFGLSSEGQSLVKRAEYLPLK
jgi:phosphate transport system substrate-binding protein